MGFCNCFVPGKRSESVWFNIWMLCISPIGQRKVGNSQSPDLTALSLGSSRPAPSCHVPLGASEEERRGGRWPSLWFSHPICHLVQWDTHSSGEQRSLQAITGFLRHLCSARVCPKIRASGVTPVCMRANYDPGSLVSLFCVGDAIWLIC